MNSNAAVPGSGRYALKANFGMVGIWKITASQKSATGHYPKIYTEFQVKTAGRNTIETLYGLPFLFIILTFCQNTGVRLDI